MGPSSDGGDLEQHMLMVLSRSSLGSGFCSATLIAENVVLTAAHCVGSKTDLRLFYRDDTRQPVLASVADIAVHPEFRADAMLRRLRTIDLALLRLSTSLPARFQPLAVGSAASAPVGSRFRVAGFGVAREGRPETAGTLRIGAIETRAPLSSVLLWARGAAGSATGACGGDSGGPVLAPDRDEIVAVINWAGGNGQAKCGALTQATYVAPQRAWITTTLARWGIR